MRWPTKEENLEFAKGAALTVSLAVIGPEMAIAYGVAPRAWALLSQAELKALYSVPALQELFKNGVVTQGLTREGLMAYREVAVRAIARYEVIGNQLGQSIQTARIAVIDQTLKLLPK